MKVALRQHDVAKAQQIIIDPAHDARGSEGMDPASNKRSPMRILSHVGRRTGHEVDKGDSQGISTYTHTHTHNFVEQGQFS